MSQGRQGKLSATVQQRSQQQVSATQTTRQRVPPLPLQPKSSAPLWRESDAADSARQTFHSSYVSATGAVLATATATGAASERSWSWDHALGVQNAAPTAAAQRAQWERAHERDASSAESLGASSVVAGSQSARAALESSSGARRLGTANSAVSARMRPPQSSAIGLSVDGEMMGAHLAGGADGFMAHTQTRSTTTTTTPVTQQQTTSTETTSALLPVQLQPSYPAKPRAVGDGGAMLSYGSDDGPSKYASTFLPSLRSSERDELAQLGEALDYFIERLDSSRLRRVRLDDRSSVEQMLSLLREEQGVYDLFFDEIIRQVSVQSRERGAVLAKIRTHYAAMLLRLPMHLHALQSELSTQQALNRQLVEEARVGRERAFQAEVELGACTHRFREAAHELEMHRDMLARAEHEKDRARVMFSAFKSEWDVQRAQLEEQLALLREEREDYLATAGATAAALARSRRPNVFAQALADESDADEERISARLALSRSERTGERRAHHHDDDQVEDEVNRLSAALVMQIERDQQKAVEQQFDEAGVEDRAGAGTEQRLVAAEAARASPDAAAVAEERRTRQAEERRSHIEAARRAEHARRTAERAAAAAAQLESAAQTRPATSLRPATTRLPSHLMDEPSSPTVHHHSLAALPDFATAAEEEEAAAEAQQSAGGFFLPPSKFAPKSSAGAKGKATSGPGAARDRTPAQVHEDRRVAAERREAKRLRRSMLSTPAAQEALQAQVLILRGWGGATEAGPAVEATCARLADLLPQIARDEIDRVVAHPKHNGCIPMLVDFLTRVDSYPFNQSELLLLRAALPTAPGMPGSAPPVALLWSEALTAELARKGLGDVAAQLFSPENARRAFLATMAQELSSSSDEENVSPESATNAALTSGATSAGHTAPQSAAMSRDGSTAELDELLSLAPAARNPRHESLRRSMEAQADGAALSAAAAGSGAVGAAATALARDQKQKQKKKQKLAREERRNKIQAQDGSASDAEQHATPRSPSGAAAKRARDTAADAASGATGSSGTAPSSATGATKSAAPAASARSRGAGVGAGVARTGSHVRSRQGSHASISTLSASTSVESLSARTVTAPATARSTVATAAAASAAPSASHSGSRPSSPRGAQTISRKKSTTAAKAGSNSPRRSQQKQQQAPAQAVAMGATLNMLEQEEHRPHAVQRGASLARRATAGGGVAAVARAEAQSDGEELQMELVGGTSSGAEHEQRSVAHSSDDEAAHTRGDKPRRNLPQSRTAVAVSVEHQPRQAQAQAQAQAPDRRDLPDVLLPGATAAAPAQQQQQSSLVESVAAAAATAPRRRTSVDPHAPRSFFEASQLVTVSKVVVAPRSARSAVGGLGSAGAGRAAVVPAETARERELQGVIDDLIAQNELLHAQRQALAAAHGVADTGAPALPASLASSPAVAAAAPSAATSDLTPLAAAPASHAGLSVEEKQNHLLAKVNEYLEAYRAAKKGAGLPGAGGGGAPAEASASATGAGAGAATPSAEAVTLPGLGTGATAQAVLSGARSLLHNSRFLHLMKGGPPPPAVQTPRLSEQKESDGSGTGRKKSSSSATPAPATAPISLAWLVRWIRGLYSSKLGRDELSRSEGAPLVRLPEYLLERQRKQYGLEVLARAKTWAVVGAVARWRDADREVALFAAFLEESRPLDELVLFLRTRAVVLQCTVGIYWAGHVHERPGAAGGASSSGTGGNGGGKGQAKCCLEFVSLCRARSVIGSIFSSSVALQDSVYRDVLARALFWHELPDPISAAKWAALLPGSAIGAAGRGANHAGSVPAYAQVDERAVSLVDLCEVVLAQFRAVELRLRHHQWAEELFDSAINSSRAQAAQQAAMALESSGSNGGGSGGFLPAPAPLPPPGEERMDFPCFASVFSLAEPRYSSREVAQLYANVTRNAGFKTLSRTLFKQLVHQLMGEGTMFPLLSQPDYERINTVRMVMRHWSDFRGFLARILHSLQHSEQTADVEAANHLVAIRTAFEHELSKAASGGGGGPGSDGAATMVGAEGAAAAASSTRRLVALYRGMLHVLLTHQSASQLATASPPPLRALHTELKVLAHVALARQRAIDGRDAAPDAWLEEVAALEHRAPGLAFGELMAAAQAPFDDDDQQDQERDATSAAGSLALQ